MKKDLGEFKLSLKIKFPHSGAACVHVLFVFCALVFCFVLFLIGAYLFSNFPAPNLCILFSLQCVAYELSSPVYFEVLGCIFKSSFL